MGWLEDLIGTSPDDNSGFENYIAPTDLFQPSQWGQDISSLGDIAHENIQPAIYPYLHKANPLEFIPRAARALSVEAPSTAPITKPIAEATQPIADIPAQMLSDPTNLALLPLFSNPVTGVPAAAYFMHQMAQVGGEEIGKGMAAQDSGESPWGHFGSGFGNLLMAGLAGGGMFHEMGAINTESSPAQFDSSRELPVEAPNPKVSDPLVNKVDAPGILGTQEGAWNFTKPYEKQKYPVEVPVKVDLGKSLLDSTPDILYDKVKGLNEGHGLFRAGENWPSSRVEIPTEKEFIAGQNYQNSFQDPINRVIAGSDPIGLERDLAKRKSQADYIEQQKAQGVLGNQEGSVVNPFTSEEEPIKIPPTPDEILALHVRDMKDKYGTKMWRKNMTENEATTFDKLQLDVQRPQTPVLPAENDPVASVIGKAAELAGLSGEKFGGYLPEDAIQHGQRRGTGEEGQIFLSKDKFAKDQEGNVASISPAAEAYDKFNAIVHELAHRNAPGHGVDFYNEVQRLNNTLDKHRGPLIQELMGRDVSPALKNENIPSPIEEQKSQGILGNQEGSVANPFNPPPGPSKVAKPIGSGPEFLRTVSKTERALLPGEKVIERMNPNIAAAEKRFRSQRETTGSEAFTVIEKAGRAANKISKNSQDNISKLFDGQNVVLSPQEMQIAKDMASELSLRGVKPQDIKAEFLRRGRADFGGIKQTLFDATEKSAERAHLGDIKVRTIGNDRNARQSMKYYQDYMRQIKGRPPAEGAPGEITAKLRQLSALGDLRKSAITQISQFSQTAGTIGLRRAIRAIPETFGKGKYEVAELKAMADGSLWANIAHETSRAMEAKDYMHGVNTVDKMMRVHANVAARMLAEDAIKGNKYALDMAREVGLKPTDPNFINRVAKELTDKTQFRTDAPHMPLWTKTVSGKLATQYMSFAYQHSRYLADLGKHPIKNFGQIARLAAVGVIVGEGIGDAKAVLDSIIPGENDEDTLIKRAIAGLAGDPNFDTKSTVEKLRAVTQNKRIPIDSPAWRAMQNLANIGGAGVFQTVLERAFDPHKDLAKKVVGTVGGAVGTHLYDAGEAAIKDVQKFNKTGEANPRNLERFAIQHAPVKVPLVNFYKLGDAILPPDVYNKRHGTRKVKY